MARWDGASAPRLERLLLLGTIHSGQKPTENRWKTRARLEACISVCKLPEVTLLLHMCRINKQKQK